MVYLVNVYIPFKNFQIQRVVQIVKRHEKPHVVTYNESEGYTGARVTVEKYPS